jgi:signal transduction histidine kinase
VAATELYRIVQEAVSNALKHGQPRQVLVSLNAEGDFVVLRVEDDGCGIGSPAPEKRGLGLRIMLNRAAAIGATLSVLPGEQAGTVVTCLMPRRKTNGKNQKESKPPRASADRR